MNKVQYGLCSRISVQVNGLHTFQHTPEKSFTPLHEENWESRPKYKVKQYDSHYSATNFSFKIYSALKIASKTIVLKIKKQKQMKNVTHFFFFGFLQVLYSIFQEQIFQKYMVREKHFHIFSVDKQILHFFPQNNKQTWPYCHY